MQSYRIGVVEYLNALPLVAGLAQADFMREHELYFAPPAELYQKLAAGELDLALLSSITLHNLPTAYPMGNYGIASVDYVASVGIFAQEPLEQLSQIVLDKDSLTSVALLKILLRNYYPKQYPILQDLPLVAVADLADPKVGHLIIGDLALKARAKFRYYYDLCQAWHAWTKLPFVFARWIAVTPIAAGFVQSFDEFQRLNLLQIPQIIAQIPKPHPCDLRKYYAKQIRYYLDNEMQRGQARFLQELQEFPSSSRRVIHEFSSG